MKKLIFTTLSTLVLLSAMAQVNQPRLIWTSSPSPADQKVKSTLMLNTQNTTFGKTGVIGGWLDNANRLVNDGIPQDKSGSSTPSSNTWSFSYPVLFPDSFVRIAYIDATTGNPTSYNPYMMHVGYLFDGRSIFWDALTNAPTSNTTLTNYSPYTLDSISFPYVYQRFNTNNNIVDTLLLEIYYPTYSTSDTNQKSPFIDYWYNAPSTIAQATVDYDPINNVGILPAAGNGIIVTMKIPLSTADSCFGGNYSRVKNIALPSSIALQSRTRFAVSFKYVPSITYAVGDTIDGDTTMMKTVKKLNNSFSTCIISDYSAFDEGNSHVLPFVDRIYNNGLLARTETRYTYSVFPSNSVFYKRFYSAGFQTQAGLALNIFPYMAAHITNVTRLGVNDVSKQITTAAIYPNPVNVNGTASVTFSIKSSTKINIDVYNVMGQLVKSVPSKMYDAGESIVDINLAGLNSGIYFVNLTSNGSVITKKLTIVE